MVLVVKVFGTVIEMMRSSGPRSIFLSPTRGFTTMGSR
jgi:hypothetical protein